VIVDTLYPAPLTAEQLAGISAGAGHARFFDPTTQVVYHVIAQNESPSLDDDYVRAKLAEAQVDVDRGDVAEWNVDELKRELQARLAAKRATQ
jgi:hypothetical protein